MGDTAVPKPTLNPTHVQNLYREILNTLWKKADLIGHMS